MGTRKLFLCGLQAAPPCCCGGCEPCQGNEKIGGHFDIESQKTILQSHVREAKELCHKEMLF